MNLVMLTLTLTLTLSMLTRDHELGHGRPVVDGEGASRGGEVGGAVPAQG